MAKAGKPRSFHEPWTTTKSALHGKEPWGGVPPPEIPFEAADKVLEAWSRIDRDADWIIWGSNMATPALCKNALGGVTVTDDKRIIAVRRTLGLPGGSVTHEEVAGRIAACVNACAGIIDPERFIAEVRALLLGYAHGEGEDPRSDRRVISLLSRCIPPEELERNGHGVGAGHAYEPAGAALDD